jgi:NAD(P)-dependent dehydrogenase (short-subunit alcohol dehydrogenase family)
VCCQDEGRGQTRRQGRDHRRRRGQHRHGDRSGVRPRRARASSAGISEPDLKAGAASLGPDTARWAVTDVTDSAQVKSAVEQAAAAFGRLDIVVANAGISGATAPIGEYPEDAFDATLAVHVRGAFGADQPPPRRPSSR